MHSIEGRRFKKYMCISVTVVEPSGGRRGASPGRAESWERCPAAKLSSSGRRAESWVSGRVVGVGITQSLGCPGQ